MFFPERSFAENVEALSFQERKSGQVALPIAVGAVKTP
jgi:hypothetical protein